MRHEKLDAKRIAKIEGRRYEKFGDSEAIANAAIVLINRTNKSIDDQERRWEKGILPDEEFEKSLTEKQQSLASLEKTLQESMDNAIGVFDIRQFWENLKRRG